MDLERLSASWDRLGRSDPLWAVLFDPRKKGRRWESGDFFSTGVSEVSAVMAQLAELGVGAGRHRALDFGCGVGRLTLPLTGWFESVDGVDIAPSMVEQARAYAGPGLAANFHVNQRDDLALFADDTFDVVLSLRVLQHVERRYVLRYLAEFLRVLKPGGVAVFDLPSGRADGLRGLVVARAPAPLLNLYRRLRYRVGAAMELHTVDRELAVEVLEANGARILDVCPLPAAPRSVVHVLRYAVQKGGAAGAPWDEKRQRPME